MGGNALKNFGSRRVESNRARAIGAIVCEALDDMLAQDGFSLQSHLIRAYRTKVDYGDLDILLPQEFVDQVGHEALVKRLQDVLGGNMPFTEDYPNAPVFHTAIALEDGGCLQVDLMPIPSENYEFAQSYYAWNDLSKTFTILARQMNGLRLGNDGLARSIKHNGRVLGSVVFTQNFDDALEFLGYDVARYHQGFDTLNDMFEFAASNPRFNTSMYQLENRNNRGRSQDKKRVTYMAFLDWMKNRKLTEYDWSEDKTDWFEKALAHFPGAREQYQALFDRQATAQSLKQRYNGHKVSAITGLELEKLGLFMEAFKKHVGENGFATWLSSSSDAEIEGSLRAFHRKWKNPGVEVDSAQP
jgi:hypothetical protein